MSTPFVVSELLYELPSGDRVAIAVRLQLISVGDGEATCRYQIDRIQDAPRDIFGIDARQALALALKIVEGLLAGAASREGHRLLYASGAPYEP